MGGKEAGVALPSHVQGLKIITFSVESRLLPRLVAGGGLYAPPFRWNIFFIILKLFNLCLFRLLVYIVRKGFDNFTLYRHL